MQAQAAPSTRLLPALAGPRLLHRQRPRQPLMARASSSNGAPSGDAEESMGLLEAFFVGRALAETVNERLGGALADALAQLGQADAELRQAAREFQDEVMERARREMVAAASSGSGSGSSSGGSGGSGAAAAPLEAAGPPDLPALVDDLRAEVAATRAVLQQVRQKRAGSGA